MNIDDIYILKIRMFEIKHQEEFSEIARKISEKKIEEAKRLIQSMRDKYEDNLVTGELIRMQTLIIRMEAIGK